MSGIYSEFLELASVAEERMERVQASRIKVQARNRGSQLRAADARAPQHKQQPVKPLHSGDLTGRNDRDPRANACTHR